MRRVEGASRATPETVRELPVLSRLCNALCEDGEGARARGPHKRPAGRRAPTHFAFEAKRAGDDVRRVCACTKRGIGRAGKEARRSGSRGDRGRDPAVLSVRSADHGTGSGTPGLARLSPSLPPCEEGVPPPGARAFTIFSPSPLQAQESRRCSGEGHARRHRVRRAVQAPMFVEDQREHRSTRHPTETDQPANSSGPCCTVTAPRLLCSRPTGARPGRTQASRASPRVRRRTALS